MTRQSAAMLHGLLTSPEFCEAIREVVADESQLQIEYMRQSVRSEQYAEASKCEGMLTLLDELPSILAKYANKFQPPQ